MATTSYAWIMMVVALLLTLTYVAILVYACIATSDGSGAKLLAIIGISLTLFCRTTHWLVPVVSARYFYESIFLIQIISQLVFGSIQCIALALIVAAVFKGRSPDQPRRESGPAFDTLPKNDPNPYVSPSA